MEGGSVADRVLRGHYRKWIANKTGGGGGGGMRILQSLTGVITKIYCDTTNNNYRESPTLSEGILISIPPVNFLSSVINFYLTLS